MNAAVGADVKDDMLNAYLGRAMHPKVATYAKELFDLGHPFVFFEDGELLQSSETSVKHPGLSAKVRDLSGLPPTRQTFQPRAFVQRCYMTALEISTANGTGANAETANTDAQIKFEELVVTAITLNASDIHIFLRYPMAEIQFRIEGDLDPLRSMPMSYETCKRMLAAAYNWNGAKSSRKPFDLKTLQPSAFQIEVTVPGSNRKLITAIRLETSPEYTLDAGNSAIATPVSAHAVVRVSPNTEIRSLEELGVEPAVSELMKNIMRRSKGMVLISGPTGAGKTTFLHGSLKYLSRRRMCFTIEDPVELIASYNPSIVQQNLLPGETYDTQLRSLMRQDPDVIMIGEIRDSETAKIAYRASNTGHLILSTTHTGSSLGTLTRLHDFGLSYSDLAQPAALTLLVACRLVGKLCPICKVEVGANHPFADVIKKRLGTINGVYAKNPAGCENCNNGTKGRASVIEYIVVTNGVRQCIERGDVNGIEPLLRKHGWESLQDKGWEMIRQGLIDPVEAEEKISDILVDTTQEFIYREPPAKTATVLAPDEEVVA